MNLIYSLSGVLSIGVQSYVSFCLNVNLEVIGMKVRQCWKAVICCYIYFIALTLLKDGKKLFFVYSFSTSTDSLSYHHIHKQPQQYPTSYSFLPRVDNVEFILYTRLAASFQVFLPLSNTEQILSRQFPQCSEDVLLMDPNIADHPLFGMLTF